MNKASWLKLQCCLADTHCHLQDYGDEAAVYDRIATAGMTVHQVTSSPGEYARILPVARGRSGVHASVGLIPQQVRALADEVHRLCDDVQRTRFVGEVGLDYVTPDLHDRQLQCRVFEQILAAVAERGDGIVSVHSRRAQDAVLDRVGLKFPGRVILHWFSGHADQLQRADDALWFSVNTAMATSKRSRDLIAQMPRERILLESDGPYIHLGDRPAEPRDLHVVVERLAQLWDCDLEGVVDQLAENYQRLLN